MKNLHQALNFFLTGMLTMLLFGAVAHLHMQSWKEMFVFKPQKTKDYTL